MKKNSNILNYRITNPSNFLAFLKKLKSVDSGVILEIEGDKIFSKVRTVDKAVIKYVSVNITDVFEGELPSERIKIPMPVDKLIGVFKYFGPEEELNFEINIDKLDGDLVSTAIKFYSDSINIHYRCGDPSLYSYVEDNIQKMTHSSDGYLVSFEMSRSNFAKLFSLSTIENNAEELLKFQVNEKGLTVSGNSFQYNLIRDTTVNGFTKPETYIIYKNQFNFVDAEQSNFYIHENRIVVNSTESETSIAIGLVEL